MELVQKNRIDDIQTLCDSYCRNIIRYNELENYDFRNVNSNQVLSLLRKHAELKHQIYEEQNGIIDQLHIITSDIVGIDEQVYKVLNDFAIRLSQNEVEQDNAMAFCVRKALLAYGEMIQDYNIIIEETYWCGVCEWKYYKIDGVRPEITYFEKLNLFEKYLPEVRDITRRRFVAGIINQLLYFTNKDAGPLLDKGREVLEKLDQIEAQYPNVPINYKAMRSVVYRNMLTSEKSFRNGIDRTIDNTEYVYEIAQESMCLMNEKQDTSIPFETVYYLDLYLAEFHARVINIEELLKKIEWLSKPDTKYSYKENYNRIFRGNALYFTYLRQYAPYDKQRIQAIVSEKVKEIFQSLYQVKRDKDSYYVNEYVLQFVESTIELVPFELVREILFRTTVSQHRDTSAHVMMTQKISEILLEDIIENNPEQLLGVMGWNTVDEIENNREEIIQLMRDMALIHDIGKYKCLSIISNASRKLNDMEFSIIKKHPEFGYEMIKNSSFAQALKDAVLLHHKWFNGKGGYPGKIYETENKPLVDILSVADCIDAATDPYGRSYGCAKSLDYMISELNEMKGTRYAPFVVDALHHVQVKQELDYLLGKTRDQILVYLCKKEYYKVRNYFAENIQYSNQELYIVN